MTGTQAGWQQLPRVTRDTQWDSEQAASRFAGDATKEQRRLPTELNGAFFCALGQQLRTRLAIASLNSATGTIGSLPPRVSSGGCQCRSARTRNRTSDQAPSSWRFHGNHRCSALSPWQSSLQIMAVPDKYLGLLVAGFHAAEHVHLFVQPVPVLRLLAGV